MAAKRKTIDIQDNSALCNILYPLTIFLSAISIPAIALCAFHAISDLNVFLLYIKEGPLIDFKNHIFWDIVIIIVLLALQKVFYTLRIKLRHVVDFNKDGLSKKFESYDKLSAAQKAKIDEQRLMDAERILDTNMLRKMTHKGSLNPEKDMEKLIGLESVKKEMSEMAARMEYEETHKKNKKAQNLEMSMHMCFLGPPGTGKTTCARIMVGFLYRYHYIKKNKCIEVDGNFLKGVNQGETSTKVTMLIKQAMGGVLFIDEAYALLSGASGTQQEAVATIVKAMEDYRDDLIIIFAGYENEMKELINSNPGIFSRIKHYMWFGNYTDENLRMIFNSMANEAGFCVSLEALDRFSQKMAIEKKRTNFGNARTVRNCLEKAIDKHSYNIINKILPEEKAYSIEAEDIILKSKEMDFFTD